MNNQTRKELDKAVAAIQEGATMLADIADNELEKLANLGNLEDSPLGQKLEESAELLQSAADEIDGAIVELEGI